MIVIKISDGLGNQFFQYALGRSLSLTKNTPLKLDVSLMTNNNLRDYQLNKYNIVSEELSLYEKIYYVYFYKIVRKLIQKFGLKNKLFKNIYWEENNFIFDENLFTTTSTYFFGYWQNYKYFKDVREFIVKELSLKNFLNQQNQEMLEKILKTNSISLHIRRGDYLKIKHQQVCDLDYYKKAIVILENKVESPTFFIFSDDIQWVKDNLQIEFETNFIDFNQDTPEYDLELMKNCKHNIIPNSTFSWWGAWLNSNHEKIVIMPKYWQVNVKTPDGLVVDDWITI